MDLVSIQTFISVKEAESFSKAAEILYLTQPAVSKRIAALENNLGTRLFDRVGKKVLLTEAGRELYLRSKKILLELEDCRRVITNLSATVSGKLSFATSHHIGLHRLPSTLQEFSINYPKVDMNIQFMNSEQAYNAVATGDVELALVTLPSEEIHSLRKVPLWQDPLALVASPSHALASTTKGLTHHLTADKILSYPAILPGPGNHTRELIIAAFSGAARPIKVKLSTNYLETIKMLISVGLGWGALPKIMLSNSALHQIHVPEITIERTLGAIHHEQRTLSNGAQALLAMLPRI